MNLFETRFRFIGKERPEPKKEPEEERIEREFTPYIRSGHREWLDPTKDSSEWCFCRSGDRFAGNWTCTRERGHKGDHAAHFVHNGQMCARWPQNK